MAGNLYYLGYFMRMAVSMPDKVQQAWDNMVNNLEEKTGKSSAQWVTIARSAGASKHGQLVTYLKSKHGLTHGYASMVAFRALEGTSGMQTSGEDLVAAQYAGEKASLRPIYDAVVAAVSRFGKDVEISPKKANVSLRRNKQFAIVQPSTKTRVDVGLNLGKTKPVGRLEASGNFSAMVSHRIRLESKREVDEELVAWLRSAYDSA